MKHNIKIVNMDDVTPKCEGRLPKFEYVKYDLIPKSSANKAKVAIYKIPPLKSAYPYHYHTSVDEIFYIIEGFGKLRTTEGIMDIKKGDVIYCPAGEGSAHLITNSSDNEPLIYMDIDTVSSADIVFYPDSDKLGILVNGSENKYYKQEANVDYYEGEDDL